MNAAAKVLLAQHLGDCERCDAAFSHPGHAVEAFHALCNDGKAIYKRVLPAETLEFVERADAVLTHMDQVAA